jgi:hypothetical protein
MYRQRFGLTGIPFPKNARDKAFFSEHEGYKRLERSFQMLSEEPGVGLLTAEPGVGKTASIRNLAMALPRPDFRVLYLCDTAIGPVDVYRGLALELGLKPAFRRATLWRELKERLLHMVDERAEQSRCPRMERPQERFTLQRAFRIHSVELSRCAARFGDCFWGTEFEARRAGKKRAVRERASAHGNRESSRT